MSGHTYFFERASNPWDADSREQEVTEKREGCAHLIEWCNRKTPCERCKDAGWYDPYFVNFS